jgi:hypothetical protein
VEKLKKVESLFSVHKPIIEAIAIDMEGICQGRDEAPSNGSGDIEEAWGKRSPHP